MFLFPELEGRKGRNKGQGLARREMIANWMKKRIALEGPKNLRRLLAGFDSVGTFSSGTKALFKVQQMFAVRRYVLCNRLSPF